MKESPLDGILIKLILSPLFLGFVFFLFSPFPPWLVHSYVDT